MNCKPAFYTLLLLAVLSCKNKPVSIIEGNLTDSGKKMLSLEYLNVNETLPLDSVVIGKNGRFRFKLDGEFPGLYIIKNSNGKIINLLVSPNEKIKIEGNYPELDKNYSVTGSSESENIRQLVEKLNDTRSRLKKLDDEYSGIIEFTEPQANEYLIRRNEIIKDQREFSITFILEHLSSMASIYALYQKLSPDELVLSENRDIQLMKLVADSLSIKYPQSKFVQSFVQDARLNEKRYHNLIGIQRKIYEAQYGLPEIAYPDQNGRIRTLSSLKGKTVLLYIWSSNSEFSLKQNPILEKTYQKYKSKGFEIFSVCIDKDREKWIKLINFEDLKFINTLGPDFSGSEAARSYNLQSVPANYLLDKEGNILGRDLFGAELEKWLDNKL
jgi:thiol-disulfide isomerase/thioredoxin